MGEGNLKGDALAPSVELNYCLLVEKIQKKAGGCILHWSEVEIHRHTLPDNEILNCTPNGTTDKITKTTLCPGFLVVVIYFHCDFGSHPNPSKDVDHRIIKYVELEGTHLTLGPAQDTLRITLWV